MKNADELFWVILTDEDNNTAYISSLNNNDNAEVELSERLAKVGRRIGVQTVAYSTYPSREDVENMIETEMPYRVVDTFQS